jgi:hypothetical protein
MKPLAFIAFFSTASLATAAPKVDHLFPAGGQRGAKVEVTFTGTFPIWPAQGWASHSGITLSPNKQSGQVTVAIAADVPCGVHWVRLFDKTGASGLRPFLVNDVPEVQESEPNDDFRKPQPVPLPVVVNGRLAKQDDADAFAVTLKKGETLVAAVEAFRTLRSPMDAVLQIVSADGFVLAQNDDYLESDPLIAFTAPKDGTYLARVFCFPATPDSRIGLFGKETCIDTLWPLALERSKGGEVELNGWNIPAENRRVTIRPGEPADRIYVHPSGFAGGAWARVEPHPVFLAGGMEALPAAPITVSGRLPKPGSRSSFAFAATKGDRLSVRLEAREWLLPLEPNVAIRGATGPALQKAQAGKLNGDVALDFTAPADGPFTVDVRDLHDDGGNRHSYLMRIRPIAPEFDANVTVDHAAARAGQAVDFPIAVNLRNGFKGPLEFRVEGLPETAKIEFVAGGAAAPTPAPKKGKKGTQPAMNATAVVRVQGLTAPMNTPFRLYALVPGQEITKREVSAALTDLNASAPFLWLTLE